MIPAIIGITSGLLSIFLISMLKNLDKKLVYGLILSGIGFLYIGFTWTDRLSLLVTAAQALIFLFLAYFGMKKNSLLLAAGYFLHGLWDLAYNYFTLPDLVPPHYDLFCLSIDFTMGIYLVALKYYVHRKNNRTQVVYI